MRVQKLTHLQMLWPLLSDITLGSLCGGQSIISNIIKTDESSLNGTIV